MKLKVLRRVQRLDSIRLDSTYFTDEGYFVDHPILTSVGIFEYMNPDGSIRRELRLPEHVFDPESLKTYKGKPIIITHEAGIVDKNNVEEEQIGTIMSAGYQDGEDVRAEIIIHDTDSMKESGLKELSLGYNLDLIEEPGEWNGESYDALQTNIRINHLALVDSARAGEQARLNIDSSSGTTLKGGKAEMRKKVTRNAGKSNGRRTDAKKNGTSSKRRNDSVELTPEELEAAIAAYVIAKAQDSVTEDEEETVFDAEEVLAQVQENKDRRDSEGEPDDLEGALEVIARQDEDIDSLLNVIEQLQAEADVTAATDSDEENADEEEENTGEVENADEDEENADADEEDKENGDGSDDESSSLNADSADRMIRQRLAICRVGDKLNMDGLESKSVLDAKKAIIKKVLPQMRLDGKGKAYINAAYDMAVEQVGRRKDVNYQRAQMTNGNGTRRADSGQGVSSAEKARKEMIERREGGTQ